MLKNIINLFRLYFNYIAQLKIILSWQMNTAMHIISLTKYVNCI
ncbi:protein of unknown function [Clostridium beijerinckii]|nr:protein of unknown function [Clostridium beijerinckii]